MPASEPYAPVLLLAGMSVVRGGIVLASREIGLGLSNELRGSRINSKHRHSA
jgi:hypothetical protein